MLRIGAVSYLNTKPLIHTLPQQLGDRGELTLDLPSRLADDLASGKLDVALIPIVEFFRGNDYEIISDAAIACRGPVWSVRLLSRVPVEQIKRLALDEGSRTSAAMVRILLKEMHGLMPETVPMTMDQSPESVDADAILMIGDRAMHPARGVYRTIWDLGDRWCRWTETPFVFAAWVARKGFDKKGVSRSDLVSMLQASRDSGLESFESIADVEAAKHGLTKEDVHRYFAENLHFHLGRGERFGMEKFHQKAFQMGFVPSPSPSDNPIMIATSTDSVRHILDKAIEGERLTPEEGLALLESHDLAAIGAAADKVSRRMHPEEYRTYNVDRNINYTNVCTAVCNFCAFYRGPKSDEGYVLPRQELLEKVGETVALGGDQILMQGGLHPKYKLDWYEELLRDIKTAYPQVNIHGFSPPELHHFTKVNNLSIEEVLTRLKAAGLGSIPGGGAEILVDRVRSEITRGKVMTDDWLNVMRVWHRLGGISTATMMFGHVETLAERIEHLDRIRSLQDETGGFTAFICWTFQPDNTEMDNISPKGAFEYLKTQAVSRLYLDNVPSIQSSWVTQGLKIGQLAMTFGANDMGSLMIEENVVAEAGTVHFLTLDQIREAITELGFVPRQRDVFYNLVDEELEQKAILANRNKTPENLVQLG
ncbi:Aminodeoxyfutalosine synthase [Rubripirellula amarantea]|uniref:Multifunctional fusion protein n=2 Tax=Rubripirellula amarantea TaxID=2527999 RepID=A0A5C5WR33_9BACT|nr:Aminodeoxyfutalosine synthase [Rubripirellula amarantea]